MLREEIARPGHAILCLRERATGPILACVSIHDEDDGRSLYFGMITVRPDLQARGFGRALLDRVEQLARARGARRVTMTVIPLRGPLVAWYERRGFHPTGEVRPFPYDDNQRFGVPKRPDLTLAVYEKRL
jgi:ribosomal protein S18 acetylase RimI-like enzyme